MTEKVPGSHQQFVTPSLFLSSLLERRGYKKPTGQLLFSYQLSSDEYRTLRTVTKQAYPKTGISDSRHIHWAACFTLYCSEWYRREYQANDGWQWSPVWEELGYDLEPNQISNIVPMGLESYWRRPIRRFEGSGARTFLGSVFIEGGLPFQLIRQSDNRFGGFIRKVLRNYYLIDLLGIDIIELVQKNVVVLPSVFSETESIELIASLTRNLMRLSNLVDLNNSDLRPSKQLDNLIPNWRNEFPIPLDDATGRELLDNWLLHASSANKSIQKHSQLISCEHTIKPESLAVRTKLLLPESLQFELSQAEVSSTRLDLTIDEGTRKAAQLGSVFAKFENQRCIVKARAKRSTINRDNTARALYAVLSEGGVSLKRQEIRHSSLPLGEMPVGFYKKDDNLVYCGHASFSVKAKSIYLLTKITSEIEVLSGTLEERQRATLCENPLVWHEINGEVKVLDGQNHYRICANADQNTRGAVELSGMELPWETVPSRVYLGLPKFNLGDTEQPVTKMDLSDYLTDKPVHSLKRHEQYGIHQYCVKNNDGNVLLKKKLGVLPSDLKFTFKNSDSGTELRVSTGVPIFIDLIVEGAEHHAIKEEGYYIFRFTITEKPPSKLTLLICANLESDPIKVSLPFPASGIYGFNSCGEELSPYLTIPQLLGSEIRLYSDKDYLDTYTLSIALKPISHQSPRFETKIKVGESPVSVSLYSFKERIIELFSLCESNKHLDAEIEIEFRNQGNSKTYTVRRFVTELDFDTAHNIVSYGQTDAIDTFQEEPQAIRIAEPEQQAIALPHKKLGDIELDRYEFPAPVLKGDVWMIIPPRGQDLAFRPRVLDMNIQRKPHEIGSVSSLQTAVRSYHPTSNPDIIAQVISQMAEDIQHKSWGYLKNLWKETGYLPMSTFQVWRDLVKNKKALTMALFVFEMNETFLSSLDIEMPVFWEMIGFEDWSCAITEYKSWIGRFMPNEQVLLERIEELFSKLISCVPSFPEPLVHFLVHNHFKETLPTPVALHLVNKVWLQKLLQDHADERWPDLLNKEISYSATQISIDSMVQCQSYQRAVVFYPALAAAIAAGIISSEQFIQLNPNTIFELKKLRDFDRDWFSSTYCFFASHFNSNTSETA